MRNSNSNIFDRRHKKTREGWAITRVSTVERGRTQHGSLEAQETMIRRWEKAIFEETGTHYKIVRTIQEKEMLRATHEPIALAKILMTPLGTINSKLIPLVIELINKTSLGLDWENFIVNKLNEIAAKYPLRQEISLAKKPNDVNSDMNRILRSYLNLDPDEKITDLHALQATLASLLTILHQGPVGSCFATSEAKQVQDEQPKWFVKDMRLLIQTGELVRIVEKEKMQFPFVPKIADDDLESYLELDSKGNISEKHFSILECIGIKEALMAMGISEPKEHLEEVVKPILNFEALTIYGQCW